MSKKGDTKKKGDLKDQRSNDAVNYFSGVGTPHPISNGVQKMREILLGSGFDEIQTSFFVPIADVRKMTGDLYPVFRDSIYHLAWIRSEPLPPTYEVDRKIKDRFPKLDTAEFWNILDSLDEDTSGEELLLAIADELKIGIDDAVGLMNMVPDLKRGDPENSTNTLRSFMPTSWISTLEATYSSEELPLRLFTIGTAFRREPNLDSSHTETYNILSVAIGDNQIDLETGLSILRKLFECLGLSDVTFKEKSYQFPFYRKGSELEIFGGDLELGTCGMVSRDVLDDRGVKTNVFIADVGVERMLMFRHGYPDIRELLFPQFFAAWSMTDEEIGSSLRYIRKPQTDYGKEIARAIYAAYKKARENDDLKKKIAWKGVLVRSDYGHFLVSQDRAKELNIEGSEAEVVLKEPAKDMGLCGPGAFNEVWIDEGDVIGVPPSASKTLEKKGAYRTTKNFVKAFSKYAAWKIERALKRGRTVKKVEKIKDLEGINLKMTSKALYYMISHSKKVDVQSPVYLKFLFRVNDDD